MKSSLFNLGRVFVCLATFIPSPHLPSFSPGMTLPSQHPLNDSPLFEAPIEDFCCPKSSLISVSFIDRSYDSLGAMELQLHVTYTCTVLYTKYSCQMWTFLAPFAF